MKKYLFFVAAFCATLSIASCGDDNIAAAVDKQQEQQEEPHIPTQSIIKSIADTISPSVIYAEYYAPNKRNDYTPRVYIASPTPNKLANGLLHQVKFSIVIKDNPGQDKWRGKYPITTATAYACERVRVSYYWDVQYRGYAMTAETDADTGKSWMSFTETGETDRVYNSSTGKYDTYKVYDISLHINEMTEENGDYARDINLSFRGKVKSGDYSSMLTN